MIQPASAVGFGIVFFAVTWLASAVLCSSFVLSRGRLERFGIRPARRAAACALALPPILGLGVVLALAGYSVSSESDHCVQNPGRLHLCLQHASGWARNPWAWCTLLVATLSLAWRLGRRVYDQSRVRTDLRTLVRLGRREMVGGLEVLVTPSETPFWFTSGIRRPRVFASDAAWDRLQPRERRAVLEHERAHIEQGDIWRRTWLELMSVWGAPPLVSKVMAAWGNATERLCDRRAAAVLGDPAIVARALVRMARAASHPARPCALAFAPECSLAERVEAVLGEQPEGDAAARRVGAAAVLLAGAAVALATLFSRALHHAVESILVLIS